MRIMFISSILVRPNAGTISRQSDINCDIWHKCWSVHGWVQSSGDDTGRSWRLHRDCWLAIVNNVLHLRYPWPVEAIVLLFCAYKCADCNNKYPTTVASRWFYTTSTAKNTGFTQSEIRASLWVQPRAQMKVIGGNSGQPQTTDTTCLIACDFY